MSEMFFEIVYNYTPTLYYMPIPYDTIMLHNYTQLTLLNMNYIMHILQKWSDNFQY